jgi:hypothetical protein
MQNPYAVMFTFAALSAFGKEAEGLRQPQRPRRRALRAGSAP